jgi:preprotein translocase subunit SecD
MDRAFWWRVGLIVGSALLALWLLVPSVFYFQLPADERNNPEKLQSVLPGWAPSPKTKLNLGLDLQGGIHLVLGVDTETAMRTKVSRRGDQIVVYSKEKAFKDISAASDPADPMKVRVNAPDKAELERFRKTVSEYWGDMREVSAAGGEGFVLVFQDQWIKKFREDAVDQALKVISNRVNRWGVSEPIIAKRGDNAILVQLPGEKDPEKAKRLLGTTALLEFKIADDEATYFNELFEAFKKSPPQGGTIETEMGDEGRSHEYLAYRGSKISREYEHVEGPGGVTLNPPYLKAMGDNAR